MDLKLAGHGMRAIDLRKLRDVQKPDFRKHTLPPDATDRSVHWIRSDGPVTGRLVVVQRNRGMAFGETKAPRESRHFRISFFA